MSKADAQEAGTAAMLRQVLANQCTLHRMPLVATLSGCGVLLAKVGAQLVRHRLATSATFLTDTAAGLLQAVRQREGEAPLPPFAAGSNDDEGLDDLDTPTIVQADGLYQVLAQLLNDAGLEQRLTVQAGWRIVLGLTADVFAMLLAQYGDDLDHVDEIIANDFAAALAGRLQAQLAGPQPPPGVKGRSAHPCGLSGPSSTRRGTISRHS